ncbi:MAG: acetyl-CoA carboxylase biotin carboxylase subunit [Desulfobacterales bacterium]|nr:acetyl-CoA carboxylase biotin carboxylase subunit [Desulfobacterales bacterium]
MFEKILIANRGEIAVRVIQTCRDMGIPTVAVYSDADDAALHRLEADEAVCIGPADPGESYLDMDKIIGAARKTGATAVHPGYGFLSENHEFAARCDRAGIKFIGPSPKVIREMGDKLTARQIMIDADVPVIPGLSGREYTLTDMLEKAEDMGYPVLIKASAGGGGKGIRVVNGASEMKEALEAASREAVNAFGDGRVYLEKFFTQARHIEFQILADNSGNTIHLLERECSIQRRHQKIIEETPSTAVSPELRERMGKTACDAARAAGYVNAGTVEFLLDTEGNYYFLEMNTRLQVEHPVTELVTGVDLVRQQILVAAGHELTLSQSDISARGHAIECRIYAEDPENDFFPSPGKITWYEPPSGPGIRNDAGVYSGAAVPVEYDPILSKLTVHAETRDQAISKMIKALKSYIVLGVRTPVDFLADVLASEPFGKGEVFTDFIDTHFSGWTPDCGDAELACLAFIADELIPGGNTGNAAGGDETKIHTPFKTLGNWKL